MRTAGGDKGHVTTRPDGWYANRPRGMREKAAPATADGPPAMVAAPRLAPTEGHPPMGALLQQIFEVDPLACPTCHGAMRLVAFMTQGSVIDQILAQLRTRAARRPTPPLGGVRRARPSHRGVRSVPAATGRSGETTSGRPTRRGGRRRAGRRLPAGARGVSDRAVCSPSTRPTPIELPISYPVFPTRDLGVVVQSACGADTSNRVDTDRVAQFTGDYFPLEQV